MAYFKRLNSGHIYLYHWIKGSDYFKISTKMQVEKGNWNEEKLRPKDINTLCKNKLIPVELARFETTLHKTLALHPELTKDSLPEFRRLFLSLLYPTAATWNAYTGIFINAMSCSLKPLFACRIKNEKRAQNSQY